ncbi:MAG: hypothetical protein ACE361_27580 [Aureliella sp.]
MAAKYDSDELTPEERFQRIASILGAGLVRLSKRKRLLKDSEQQSDKSPPISGDSADDRLESSPGSGLTVHDG